MGYAVAGFALFGSSKIEYSEIMLSFFRMVRMMKDQTDYKELEEIEPYLALPFLVSFIVIYFKVYKYR